MLKAVGTAAVLLFAIRAAAAADTLLTGAIRDGDGAPVAGAHITAFDLAGRTVGADVATVDGTFALAAPSVPATVLVACDYCRPVRRPVVAGEPLVVIVERYEALTAAGPSPADLRALPYRSAGDSAALLPFTVVDAGRVADRGLDREGAVAIDGLPFYDAANGNSAIGLLPAHAVASLEAASPLAAPRYGGYASAGVYEFALVDPEVAGSRVDLGDARDLIARAELPAGGADRSALRRTRTTTGKRRRPPLPWPSAVVACRSTPSI